jgi:hypothetical protein
MEKSPQHKENQKRRVWGIGMFTGMLGLKYFIKGVYQPSKEVRKKRGLPLSGTIFKQKS